MVLRSVLFALSMLVSIGVARAYDADIIVVLGGADARATMGGRLYAAGAAPLVLASGGGESLARGMDILRAGGVPEDAIIVNDRATSTYDEAEGNIARMREHGVQRALIVTHDWHMARALAPYRYLDSNIEYVAAAVDADLAPSGDAEAYQGEGLKRLGYWLLYGVPPLPKRAGENRCDFSAAERVVIGDYTTGERRQYMDAATISAPSSWAGATFWQGYDSPTPFSAFYDAPMRYLALFQRGREVVGMIEARGDMALLMDEGGKVADSLVWHGCAAIEIDEAARAWFTAEGG